MSVTIGQLRDVAWYCENKRDTDDMIQCLKSMGIHWRSGDILETSDTIYRTIADGYAFLLDYSRDCLVRDSSVYFGQKLLRRHTFRSEHDCDIPLISWTKLCDRSQEPVSLSEYLLS